MHSRIFELKTNKETENTLCESSIEPGTMDYFGIDYVSDMKTYETKESMEWLQSCYPDAIKVNIDTGTLQFIDPKKLMQDSFKEFQSALEKLNKITIDDFIKENISNPLQDIGFDMWSLNNAYSNHSGFYIYTENCFRPINDFVRKFQGNIEEQIFYIGNVLDYHC